MTGAAGVDRGGWNEACITSDVSRISPEKHPTSEGVSSMSDKQIKRILIATDGSPSASYAVEVGVELARAEGAEVTFVHVAAPIEFRSGRSMARPVVPRRLGHIGDAVLDDAALVASNHGVGFERELIAGDPGDVIVALADAIDADLVVVGERPRKLRVGPSVARWVARHTRRHVLVARPLAAELAA
jgi:nucleotide-binding universal stress UspA family protein